MFEYSPVFADTAEGVLKHAAIFAAFVSPARLDKSSQSAPSCTWGMSYYRVRTSIQHRIALFVPWIDVFQLEINTVFFNEKRRNHQ
jgi:hypothetical protein